MTQIIYHPFLQKKEVKVPRQAKVEQVLMTNLLKKWTEKNASEFKTEMLPFAIVRKNVQSVEPFTLRKIYFKIKTKNLKFIITVY
jgi:hypothetical protein